MHELGANTEFGPHFLNSPLVFRKQIDHLVIIEIGFLKFRQDFVDLLFKFVFPQLRTAKDFLRISDQCPLASELFLDPEPLSFSAPFLVVKFLCPFFLLLKNSR